MSNSFNFEEALKELQAGKDLTGKDGVLMPLIKQLTEAVISAVSMANKIDPLADNNFDPLKVKIKSHIFCFNR